MRLISITAMKIFGYLDYYLDFNQDLNLLIGTNGSGKTTILKMILAIFANNFVYLASLNFKEIELKYIDNNGKNVIVTLKGSEHTYKNKGKPILSSFEVFVSNPAVEIIVSIRDGEVFAIEDLLNNHGEYLLSDLGRPMFLGA
ncbi:AAA family ATPase [Vitreoscilla massiliensis]|uniref:AAA family ATPase n=1 Tax=Vitreoscilla massiliensis TaxID=1689272 RepID=A0ABY4E5L1_9NEIS|nr:AAA family ATPase [Vitreoscilla massiliensis]UOO91042.1 AAA family ATPase [Vitreoscilla massiliensis]